MAQPYNNYNESEAQASQPNIPPIFGPEFCVPYERELAIVRQVSTITDGNFRVRDVNDDALLLKVKGSFSSFRDRRLVLNAAGRPILTLQQKILTAHSRWEVFRGDSIDSGNLKFSAKTTSMIQFKTKLDVFLATNNEERVCDYKLKGSWRERSCVIYAGESSTVIAQMHKKRSAQSVFLGKDKFMVIVYPNIDYAFIVALIVILHEINS